MRQQVEDMPPALLAQRVSALEADVALLKRHLHFRVAGTDVPWWERRFGAFENDPMYDEALQLGTEYRRSQQGAADARHR